MIAFIKKQQSSATGLMFFLVMGLIGYSTIIQTRTYGSTEANHLPILLNTAEGMQVGAPVYILGVKAGVLSAVHYVQVNAEGVPLPWKINPEQKQLPAFQAVGQKVLAILDLERTVPLYPNYKIQIKYRSLISQKIVEIDPGRKDPNRPNWRPLLLTYKEMYSYERSGKLPNDGKQKGLVESGNSDDPLYLISTVINENRTSIRAITSNLREISHRIDKGNGTVSLFINRSDLHDTSNQLILEMVFLVQQARELLETLRESQQYIDVIQVLFGLIFKFLV